MPFGEAGQTCQIRSADIQYDVQYDQTESSAAQEQVGRPRGRLDPLQSNDDERGGVDSGGGHIGREEAAVTPRDPGDGLIELLGFPHETERQSQHRARRPPGDLCQSAAERPEAPRVVTAGLGSCKPLVVNVL